MTELKAGNVFGPKLQESLTVSARFPTALFALHLQHGKVGKVVHIGPHVRLSPCLVGPLPAQTLAILANNVQGSQEVLDLEASGKHDDVKVLIEATFTDYAGLCYFLDPLGKQVDVLVAKTRQVPRVKYPSFAA